MFDAGIDAMSQLKSVGGPIAYEILPLYCIQKLRDEEIFSR